MLNYRTVTPLALIFGFLFGLSALSCSLPGAKSNSEIIYLIPENFRGAVVVLFNQPDGITAGSQDGKYILSVPDDGILKIRGESLELKGKPAFYLINQNGDRSEIELLYRTGSKYSDGERTTEDLSEAERKVVYAISYDQSSFNDSHGKTIKFKKFIIGAPENIEKLFSQQAQKMVSVMRNLY